MLPRAPVAVPVLLLSLSCGEALRTEDPPIDTRDNVDQQGLFDCSERQDTGYRQGDAFPITVVTVDGRPVEVGTANAYIVMQEAAAADGVELRIVSGFRTMDEQEYFYGCYVNCNCNNCNLAAVPGTSNHQSGHALDLNTSEGNVLWWLNTHGGDFGFSRTVPSEAWHWEWWGGGPGGGPCGASPECVANPNAGGCDGSVVTRCDETLHLGSGDCGFFGAACSTGGGAPHCVHPLCTLELEGAENGTFCADATRIGTCAWGAYTEGDCAAFGGTCSEAGGTTHCVHFQCWSHLGGGEDGSFCVDGQLASCTLGALTLSDCGAPSVCTAQSDTAAVCADPDAPPAAPEPDDDANANASDGDGASSRGRSFAPAVEPGGCVGAAIGSELSLLLLLLAPGGAVTRRRRRPVTA